MLSIDNTRCVQITFGCCAHETMLQSKINLPSGRKLEAVGGNRKRS